MPKSLKKEELKKLISDAELVLKQSYIPEKEKGRVRKILKDYQEELKKKS